MNRSSHYLFLLLLLPLGPAMRAADGTGAATNAENSRRYRSVQIREVPHVRQKPDFCGEACAEMYLRKLGRRLDQDFVFDQSGLSPELGRGCYTRDLAKALSRIGFRIGATWYSVPPRLDHAGVGAQFDALHQDLLAGIPSIVCMHYDQKPQTTEHFRLVLGYDATKDEVIYHEPAVDRGADCRMPRDQFLRLWPLKYRSDRWTIVRLRLEPGRLVPGESSRTPTDADYAQHILHLRKRPELKDFHVVLQKPFVVVGDESLEQVRQRSENTIRWAVTRLKRDYFTQDPDHIINIWLFKDRDSYGHYNQQLFGSRPTTPFGYYSPSHQALVMNISTGGGTLVHEIVHPFMAANFPDCPSWFNEGLASLYEQCSDRDGQIWGLPNWRLAGLKKAIVDQRVPSFQTLCSTTTRQFYDADSGTNYAQARYLCYYLQEHKLLRKYYHEFRRTAKADPTGYNALVRVLKRDDLDRFQAEWEKFILRIES